MASLRLSWRYFVHQHRKDAMPLVQVSLRQGKPVRYRQSVLDSIYDALRATFDVPEDDRFMTITEHDSVNFSYSASYLGIARSDDLLIIQVTVSNTRTVLQKQALYRRIATNLSNDPGVRPEDIFINLVEVLRENWSFGRGLAQYVEQDH